MRADSFFDENGAELTGIQLVRVTHPVETTWFKVIQ